MNYDKSNKVDVTFQLKMPTHGIFLGHISSTHSFLDVKIMAYY